MRLIFMGTSAFSVPSLKALDATHHEIVAIYTQPPRPAQRGHRTQKTPVHSLADSLKIPIWTPERFARTNIEKLRSYQADIAIVVAYGILLPEKVLNLFPYGCLNIHASLLPRWRGAAPIQRCIEAGDQKTGITIMQMEKTLDTGPLLLQKSVPVTDSTTSETLSLQLSELGAALIVEALKKQELGTLIAMTQNSQEVTYATKLSPEEGHIRWSGSAQHIERSIRALTPWPGSWCFLKGERLKILQSQVTDHEPIQVLKAPPPGSILSIQPLIISCGKGALTINRLQKAGKKPMNAKEFINGFPLSVGDILC